MPFVIDVSAMIPWTNLDEAHPHADAAFVRARQDAIVVPSLWWFELRNALLASERRRRTTADRISAFLRSLDGFDITIDRTPNGDATFRLARDHGLTIYNSAYLELALRRGMALATLDGALIKAATRECVTLVGQPH